MTGANDTALLVIDVQEEYFGGRLPIGYPPREDSLERIGAAMDHATSVGVPVIVVRHVGEPGEKTFQVGTPTQELRPEVTSRPYDHLIDKELPGSFTGTDLEQWLRGRDINHVTIVGYMTNVCCDTTARQALHMGMGATILHDAVGVPPMPSVDGQIVDPETLQRSALAPLGLIGVELMTTDEWVERT
ncbi:MAG TPA: cysteine hydrolase family protein [Acidimicrobiales bacterium]|nr:cysteine hydrolase family protein [Acidimicrobiales bacterium]